MTLVGCIRAAAISAPLADMKSMLETKTMPLRRCRGPPFSVCRATKPETIPISPATMWNGSSASIGLDLRQDAGPREHREPEDADGHDGREPEQHAGHRPARLRGASVPRAQVELERGQRQQV